MRLRELAAERLRALDEAHLRRTLRRVASAQGPWVELDGRKVLGLCSNNYLGLANHPDLIAAAHRSLEVDGLGAGASRLVSGSMDAHEEAERALAEFVGAEASILFSTGYAANVGTLAALVGPGDVVFSDALNHASLIDGCRLSKAQVHVYRHLDVEHLEGLLREHRPNHGTALIVTDSIFSMDGDEAPLPALRALADRHDAALLLDEAHAVGVLGPGGRGLAARDGVTPDLLVGALGKAFGLAGTFVAAAEPVVELLRNRARSFVFSTAPLPLTARAATAAVPLVLAADERRATVLRHATRLRTELRELGYRVPEGGSPIVPVVIGDAGETYALSQRLLDAGVFAQAIRPPTVARGTARLRVVPIATHSDADLDHALQAFRTCRPQGTRA